MRTTINVDDELLETAQELTGQAAEQPQHLRALPKHSTREFANDEGMRQHFLSGEHLRQRSRGAAEVIDPDGSVDEDHDTRRLRFERANRVDS